MLPMTVEDLERELASQDDQLELLARDARSLAARLERVDRVLANNLYETAELASGMVRAHAPSSVGFGPSVCATALRF